MPCRSDHMEPNAREREATKIFCLIDEAYTGRHVDPDRFRSGMHDEAYNRGLSQETLDDLTEKLCTLLTRIEANGHIGTHSLELQTWWRDHKAWDAKRKKTDRQNFERGKLRKVALSKLTDAEKEVLGL